MKRVACVLVALLALSACRTTAERRPVSLREQPAPAGRMSGQIAYVEETAVGRSRLVVENVADDSRTTLPTKAGYVDFPAWSADGARIAYSLTAADDRSHIWVASADGSGARQITNEATASDDYPAWSPDGTQIAFASTRKDGKWRLYLMSADGSGARELGVEGFAPTWSPDGAKLAYAVRESGLFKLRAYTIASGATRALTAGPGNDLYPHYNADGKKIVFSSTRQEKLWQVYILDVDRGDITRLIGSDSEDRFPVFSPDGRYIALSANHLAVYGSGGSLGGGTLRWRLTKKRAWAPAWKAGA